ncbi:MAG: DNA methyltransferase [Vampirovibrionales bacterium]|nr:DNA methyltransferase [Vampirovibrionales bacterium]
MRAKQARAGKPGQKTLKPKPQKPSAKMEMGVASQASGGLLANAQKDARPLAYSDLDVSKWRDYQDIEIGSLWQFDARERKNGHQLDYHGNCVPQILTQLLTRFTKSEDVVLDLFLGSGTSAIEAANLGRKAIGVELKEEMADYVRQKLAEQGKSSIAEIIQGDSSQQVKTKKAIEKALLKLNSKNKQSNNVDKAQFLFLHPPYADIIRFSELPNDLSNAADTEAFLDQFEAVCRLGYECLEPGRFAAVVIGDKYSAGELIPLGFYCMDRMNRVGFKTKSIIVKNITGNEKAKGRMNNLWRYRALVGGFYLFKHEYVLVFQKPVKESKLRK